VYGPAAFWAPHPRLVNRAELEASAAGTMVANGPVVAEFEPTDVPFRWVSRQQAEEYLNEGGRPTQLGA
jgi:hypothetical protein